MLTHKTQTNLVNAETYFDEHLRVGDYYTQSDQTLGQWHGVGAHRLALNGTVDREAFLKLCNNRHPQTGERLTQRQKSTRMENGREVANRRVFFDFTFSPAKSVSIVAVVGDNKRLQEAHDKAVALALAELETFAATRVHSGMEISDRLTGNFIAATFRHDTSRALDPHLHTHCILFNPTHDATENRWKAVDNFEMLRARKYVENVYYHELAKSLRSCGYEIENHARGDFQVTGVSAKLCDRFSKRHQEIDARADELLAQKPQLGGGINALRENIAQKERPNKVKDITTKELRERWSRELTTDEHRKLSELRSHKLTFPRKSGQVRGKW